MGVVARCVFVGAAVVIAVATMAAGAFGQTLASVGIHPASESEIVGVDAVDVNGDGLIDIVTRSADETYSLRLAKAPGDFESPDELSMPVGLAQAFADLDGDGADEYIVLWVPLFVSVYTFTGTDYELTSTIGLPNEVSGFVVGRLNRDAHLDLVTVMAATGRVRAYLGDGTGALVEQPDVLGPIGAADLALADVDDNGFTDVVTRVAGVHGAGLEDGKLRVLLQHAPGAFELMPAPDAPFNGQAIYDVFAGDINGDGIGDVAVAWAGLEPGTFDTDAFTVMLGEAGVGLGEPTTIETAVYDFSSLSVVDIEGDGSLEFVQRAIIDWHDDALVLDGDGPDSAATADVDLDGFPDMVAAGARRLHVLRGTGERSWREFVPFRGGGGLTAVVDVDEDGRLDIVRDDGDGVFIARGLVGSVFSTRERLEGVVGGTLFAVSDVDGDGHLDVVAGDSTATELELSTSFGFGDGTFGNVVTRTMPIGLVGAIDTGEFSGDGSVDLFVSAIFPPSSSTVGVLIGDGAGGFAVGAHFSPGQTFGPNGFEVSDCNVDGLDDVVTVVQTRDLSTRIAVRLMQPSGAFEPAAPALFIPTSSVEVAVGDVNGDGIPDIVTSKAGPASPGDVVRFSGVGDGTFGEGFLIPSVLRERALAIFDVDGNERADIISLGSDPVSIEGAFAMVVSQVGGGSFQQTPLAQVPGFAGGDWRRPIGADLNNDGVLDVVIPMEDSVALMYLTAPTWSPVGDSFAGPHGFSALRTEGTLEAETEFIVEIPNGPPDTRVALISGMSIGNTPFLGGVLVPTFEAVVHTRTDAQGMASLSLFWPDLGPFAEVYIQAWFPSEPASTIALRGKVAGGAVSP